MPDGPGSVTARTLASISEVRAEVWNGLANPPGQIFNPFVSHEFLSALETSKSISPEVGWAPMHLVLEDANTTTGVAPLYAKGHSQGEYIFDHHWADAYARAGGQYYPKLLCAAPFTPAQGPRLLAQSEAAKVNLAIALRQISERIGASSAHVNFINEGDKTTLEKSGYLLRMGEQYHWLNKGYETFDDFLAAMSSRKRKAIRRERREANNELTIRRLVGDEITERHWDAFWIFYQDTGARKWGTPYLTRTFFRQIAESIPEQILMIVAERDGEPIAGALNLIGGDTLYGRYWGCTEDVPFLHFELCYHQAVDFAIERGLAHVEAGAQGQHKIARGYEPVSTWSAHWINNDSFRDAISRYLEAERESTNLEIEALKDFTPYKKS
ncbi:GNAT family N-acetyltransferase [Hyphococcus lacteus]|uniref:GNAT family N-acetyltransferase n=1 Tax=Hyphococcus lacteus TaxID=3143536 RepID=A0ABV3ZA88_9PROT